MQRKEQKISETSHLCMEEFHTLSALSLYIFSRIKWSVECDFGCDEDFLSIVNLENFSQI